MFTWPQLQLDGDEMAGIARSAFPERGCVPLTLIGSDKYRLEDDFGRLVVMRINDADIMDNTYYKREGHVYNGAIDPGRKRGESKVEFRMNLNLPKIR